MRTYTLVSMVGVILLYACSGLAESSPNKSTSMTEASIIIVKDGLLSFSKTTSASIDGILSTKPLVRQQKAFSSVSMQKYLKIAALLRKENMCTQSS
jgi:hypothetical protein